MEVLDYFPPLTIKRFIVDYLPGQMFYDWIIGPVGSGKTTGIFMKLVNMASKQAKGRDGIRRSRAVVVRNTMPQLKDTTLVSWRYWFKDGQAGDWNATDKIFTLRFADVECEVLFRPLDTEEDVQRVLSLEVTFAILDEFVQIPKKIIEALAARCGRFPSKKDGGATNWGMWGSSNPDTEDCWWYGHLHNTEEKVVEFMPFGESKTQMAMRRVEMGIPMGGLSIKYFHQPGGYSPEAENVDNLPGGRAYYDQQTVGKSVAWVKQFVDSEWGFSIAGQPVVRSFDPTRHIAKSSLIYDPRLPLVAGLDPGLGGSAIIFGQQTLFGRLNVLGELVQSGYGAKRLISERMKPYIQARFPNALDPEGPGVIIAPDPASASKGQRDEVPIVNEFKKHFPVSIETNNRLPLRLDAIDHFTTRSVDLGPALQIDPYHCMTVIRALKGGWRYILDKKYEQVSSVEPEKNPYSHSGDGFGYLCRYFHRQTEREMHYMGLGGFKPPMSFGGGYHVR